MLLIPVMNLAVCLALACASAAAQSFDATALREPTDLASATWLIHAGDDPDYASPEFDDSGWTRFDPHTSVKSVLSNGHPDIVWYRLHIKVAPSQNGLALLEYQVAAAFEVYANGQRIMQCGQVAPFVPYTYRARLLASIPDRELANGSLIIAMRLPITPTDWSSPYPGLYAANLTLGQESELKSQIWLDVVGDNGINWVIQLAGLGLGIVALALFSAQRRQWEYLWIFLQFFSSACTLPLAVIEAFQNVPVGWNLAQQSFRVAASLFTVLMYLAFLRLRFGWWMRALVAVAVIGQAISSLGVAQGSISTVVALLAVLPFVFLTAGVLPVLAVVHLRRGNREAGILLIPLLLQSLTIYAQVFLILLTQIPAAAAAAVRWQNLFLSFPAGPFKLSIYQLSLLLYLLSLAIIMVLRSTRISRQQALLEGEVAAAREVQQVILPEQVESVPGFTVESVYQPAQEVGGDFFQVLPDGRGGLLIVVGDVAGKGLPAAMLVSVLVGAIRTAAAYSQSPEEVLSQLNDRLLGRTHGGFSTALATHITAEGWVTIANAGHLSPYLDGREINLPGALPLGIVGNGMYDTTHFHLAHGSRLTFYSDGVVEARNQRGELFGFDRAKSISTQSAASIVEAAIQFGQSDDITVVAIERTAAFASAA